LTIKSRSRHPAEPVEIDPSKKQRDEPFPNVPSLKATTHGTVILCPFTLRKGSQEILTADDSFDFEIELPVEDKNLVLKCCFQDSLSSRFYR
jgi:hypothetical protein